MEASSLTSSSIAPTSAAGGLCRLVAHLHSSGQAAVASADGREAWTPGARAELQRLPLEPAVVPSPASIRQARKAKGIFIVSFLQSPTESLRANCFNYVCDRAGYDVEQLDKNGRRDVRRGLRCFSVRRCGAEEIAAKGFPAFGDTESRHGHLPPTTEDLRDVIACQENDPFVEFWGAWQEENLAAWLRVLKVDDWAFITNAYSASVFLRDCPNNALAYEVTRTCLAEEKRAWISYGISSLQATDNILSLHKFKLRMGYQALPRVRTFVVRPLLWPLLGTRLAIRWRGRAPRSLAARAAIKRPAGSAGSPADTTPPSGQCLPPGPRRG
ncbi:MAG: hypothetical protein NT031_17705 [Planctomycetota bacterium]|nr:hypothetical protein [Planctomycetota bacterium]